MGKEESHTGRGGDCYRTSVRSYAPGAVCVSAAGGFNPIVINHTAAAAGNARNGGSPGIDCAKSAAETRIGGFFEDICDAAGAGRSPAHRVAAVIIAQWNRDA